jgi:hypothetical protein
VLPLGSGRVNYSDVFSALSPLHALPSRTVCATIDGSQVIRAKSVIASAPVLAKADIADVGNDGQLCRC